MSQWNYLGGYLRTPALSSSLFLFPTIPGKWWQIPLAQSAPRNPGKQWHIPETHSPFPWQLRGQSCTESETKMRNLVTAYFSACSWSNNHRTVFKDQSHALLIIVFHFYFVRKLNTVLIDNDALLMFMRTMFLVSQLYFFWWDLL